MNPSAPPAADDPRVIEALDEYVAAIESGRRPNRTTFLAEHADIAGPLADCLDGLDLVHHAAAKFDPPAADADLAGATPLGDFRLLRVIGRGGMGVVYEAEQLSLGRRVALKVLPFAAALDARQLQRFKHEAQAAAHLHHPHIVPVHAVGSERGVHYYAMQLIDGRTLAALIEDLRAGPGRVPIPDTESAPTGDFAPAAADTEPQAALSTEHARRDPEYFQRAARLGLQAAQALEYAHQVGVIHRDVKPANLLVDIQDHLWVTDFGLAQFHGRAGLTMTGDVLGTLRYMSPEQGSGGAAGIDHRTDVYSLGATLFELLTLRPVVAGMDRAALVRQILDAEPVPLRRLQPHVPRDLETIVLKALAKDPTDRYATAQAMADDLQRYLEDRPVAATRPGVWRRVRKWARRHRPVVATAAVAGVSLLVTAVVVLSVSMARVAQEEKRKDEALDQAEVQRGRAEENFQRLFDIVDSLMSVGGVRPDDGPDIDTPEVTQVRCEILERALRAYKGFLPDPTDEPASRYEASIILCGIARLQQKLGRLTEGLEAGRRARELAEGLVAEFPHERKYLRQQCVVDGWFGSVLPGQGRYDEAERLLRRSISFWEEALTRAPPPGAPAGRAARTADLKKWDQAPDEAVCNYHLAALHQHLAYALQVNQRVDSIENRRRSAAFWQKAAAQSGDPDHFHWGVIGWHNLGYELCKIGKTSEGLEHLSFAVKRAEWLFAAWPAVPRYRKLHAYVLNALGVNLRLASRPRDAEAAHADALRQLDALAAEFPDHDTREERSRALYHRALALWRLEERDEALTVMRAVLPIIESEPPPKLTSARPARAGTRHALGQMLEALDRRDEAEAEYRKALAHVERQEEVYSEKSSAERDRIVVYFSLAHLLAKSDRPAEGESVLKGLHDWMPSSPEAQNNLAWHLASAPESRFRNAPRAVELAAKAVATSSDGTFRNTLGVARYRNGDWTGAIAELDKARAALGDAHDSFSTFFLAMAHWRLGDHERARRWYDLAVAWMDQHQPKNAELVRFRAEAKALLETKSD